MKWEQSSAVLLFLNLLYLGNYLDGTSTYTKRQKELQLKLAVSCFAIFLTCPAPPSDGLEETEVGLATSPAWGRSSRGAASPGTMQ